jgi:hypothetical protein
MTTSPQPRNNFVVQLESGHPGFHNYVILATPAGLRDLAARLEQLAEAPLGARFDVYVTRRGEPRSLGSLAFSQCNPEQLVLLQQRSASVIRKKLLVACFYIAVFALALTGWLSFVGYVEQWLGISS